MLAVGTSTCLGCRYNKTEKQSPASSARTTPQLDARVSANGLPTPKTRADAQVDKIAGCNEIRTVTVGDFDLYGVLQNLRIAADAKGGLLTWERYNDPVHGDNSQIGFASFLSRDSSDTMTKVALPARAYAAAAYTTVAPSTVAGQLDLLASGVAGSPEFSCYSGGAGIWKVKEIFLDNGPSPIRAITLPFSLTESLVAGQQAPIAILAGVEAPCESYYACEKEYEAAVKTGLPRSLRSLSFAGKTPLSEVLFKGTDKTPEKPFVPAVAARASSVLAVYRVDERLEAQWLSLLGKKVGSAFVMGERGDIGAPAVTFVGTSAYATWAYRPAKTEPYRLWVARVGTHGIEASVPIDTGEKSAFAPGVAELDGSLLLVWMQGDEGRHGMIRLGQLPTERVASTEGSIYLDSMTDLTPGDGNRRDPEIAAQADRIYIAWSDFTLKKAGIPVLRILSCGITP